jgi:hypothetical protein
VHSGTELILSAAEGIVMSTPSLDAEVLTLLEEQVAFHREQLEKASRLLERARAAVAVREPLSAALAHTPLQEEDLTSVSRMVARLVEAWPPGSPFGATLVAEEIGRRFGREATPAEVSVKLRRLSHNGVIRTVREGQSHIESLFEKPHG